MEELWIQMQTMIAIYVGYQIKISMGKFSIADWKSIAISQW